MRTMIYVFPSLVSGNGPTKSNPNWRKLLSGGGMGFKMAGVFLKWFDLWRSSQAQFPLSRIFKYIAEPKKTENEITQYL